MLKSMMWFNAVAVVAAMASAGPLYAQAVAKSVCTGTGADNVSYTLKLGPYGAEDDTLSAVIDAGNESLYTGNLKLLGQEMAVDPKTHQKFETNRYWAQSASGQMIEVDIVENDLLRVTLGRPELIEALSCRPGN